VLLQAVFGSGVARGYVLEELGIRVRSKGQGLRVRSQGQGLRIRSQGLRLRVVRG
jgi:hypothetical protein